MKFRAWIMEMGGTATVAKILGKKQKAVQHWLTGRTHPKLKDAERILRMARGKLSLSDILKTER